MYDQASDKMKRLVERASVYWIEIDGEEINLGVAMQGMISALEWYAEPVATYAVTQSNEPRSASHADKGGRARSALQI